MNSDDNYIELVKQAQLGDEESINSLSELVRDRLRLYVQRLMLYDNAMEDIVQESMLEMLRFIKKLKRADRFWPWLYKIAANKVNQHYKRQQIRKTVPLSEAAHEDMPQDPGQWAEMLSRELKNNIFAAMQKPAEVNYAQKKRYTP